MASGRGNLLLIISIMSILLKQLGMEEKEGAFVNEVFILLGILGSWIYNKYIWKR